MLILPIFAMSSKRGVLPLRICMAYNVQVWRSCQINLCLSAMNMWTVPDWAQRRSGHRTRVNGHDGSTANNLGNLGEGRFLRPEPPYRCWALFLVGLPFALAHALRCLKTWTFEGSMYQSWCYHFDMYQFQISSLNIFVCNFIGKHNSCTYQAPE